HIDPTTGHLAFRDLHATASAGGELRVPSATLDVPLEPGAGTATRVDAKIELARVDLTPLLPADQRALLGGHWTGSGTLAGRIDQTLALRGLDLTLDRAH